MRSIGRSRIAVPVAIVLALLVLVVNETGYRSAQHFELASSDAVAARLALVQLRRQLVAAESAQRGYLITARPEYKAPFLQARAELQGKVEELQRRFGPDHPHAQAVRRLEKAAVERISELDEVLRLFELGDRERAVTLVLTDIGREKMDAVDENVELIESATLTAFLGHQARQQQALAWSHVGIAVLTLFGLLVVLASLRQLRLRESERAQQQAELQAERDKLETEVAARTAELTEIATHLQTVREDERGRLARELHDELGGLMTAAKVDVARLKNKLGAMPDSMSERIAHLVQLLDAAIALKRRIIEDLQPSALKHLGLQTALQIMCDEVARASEIEITTTIEDITLSEQRALTIYPLGPGGLDQRHQVRRGPASGGEPQPGRGHGGGHRRRRRPGLRHRGTRWLGPRAGRHALPDPFRRRPDAGGIGPRPRHDHPGFAAGIRLRGGAAGGPSQAVAAEGAVSRSPTTA